MLFKPLICLGEENTLLIATSADFPPMESLDSSNEFVGFDIDLMRAVAKEAGFSVEFKNVSWYTIFAGLDSGKYDAVISCVTITQERSKQYDFSIPYLQGDQVLVAQKEEKAIDSLNNLNQK
jgi:polar amino acid transport system substrate-binding protein